MGQTTAYSGFGGSVSVSSSVNAEVREWSLDINIADADVTRLSASANVDRIFTRRDGSGTFNSNVYIPALATGAVRTMICKTSSGNSTIAPQFTFRAIISPGVSVPGDAVDWTYSYVTDGPITVATS
jgi:hypothetical protein